MACRIGITTNPGERKRYWQGQHPTLRNWRILERHSSKSAAQNAEYRLSKKDGCIASAGGDGPEYTDWVVYKFEY